jgi:hypothetical protein
MVKNAMYFLLGRDGGQAFRFFGTPGVDGSQVLPQRFAVEEEQSAEGPWSIGPRTKGLILGGGGDAFLHGQLGEKGFYFSGAHFSRKESSMDDKW